MFLLPILGKSSLTPNLDPPVADLGL